jgi:dihydropteroate synthase
VIEPATGPAVGGELLGLPEVLVNPGRCLVMGVINVTPDSFSDGGRFDTTQAALARGRALLAAGADLVDVGGESTRPGAGRIGVETKLARVLPVVRGLAEEGAVVSIDTMRTAVAERALAAGAAIVNDISGGLADGRLPELVAEARVPYIAMHWKGFSDVMESLAVYQDVVAEVVTHARQRLDALTAAGVDPRQVILDPGFGFAKRPEHSWSLLANLDALLALGRPVLVGTSRKRFLAEAVRDGDADRVAPHDRDHATAATSALAAAAGAWGVRVHEVAASADAVRVAAVVARHRAAP